VSALSQPELISAGDIERAMFAQESSGRYTADRLHDQRPAVYAAVVRLLAEGWSARRITELLGCHPYTIAAVREREAPAIETQKETLGRRALAAARLAVDSLLDALNDPETADDIGARDRALIAGILVDKAQLLLGGATSRVEHVDAVPAIEDYERWVRALPVTPESTGLEGGEPRQKGELAPAPAPRDGARDQGDGGAGGLEGHAGRLEGPAAGPAGAGRLEGPVPGLSDGARMIEYQQVDAGKPQEMQAGKQD
jgi:hypothetical protein